MLKTMGALPKACLAGSAAGLVTGFFGAGGGMVLIPLLTRLCGLPDRKAFASSVSIVLPVCLCSLAIGALRGGLSLSGAWPYLLGGLLGGLAGGLLFRRVPVRLLHGALGLFILWGGANLLLR